MAKTPRGMGSAGGWPRRRGESQAERKARTVERIATAVLSGTLGDDRLRDLCARLADMLSALPGLRAIRPSPSTVASALKGLSDAEMAAMAGRGRSAARARRVRARVYPKLFDAELLERLRGGLAAALRLAQSQAEIEAAALGAFFVAQAQTGGIEPAENPLFHVLTELIVSELLELRDAFEELKRRQQPAEGQPPPSEEEKDRIYAEMMATNPALRSEFKRFVLEHVERLYHGIADGTIESCLTQEELQPVSDELERCRAEQGPDAPAAAGQEVMDIQLRFARDPANGPAYERFTAQLDAEVEQVRADGEPDAEALAETAAFWREHSESMETLRAAVAQASFQRIMEDGEPADDSEEQGTRW